MVRRCSMVDVRLACRRQAFGHRGDASRHPPIGLDAALGLVLLRPRRVARGHRSSRRARWALLAGSRRIVRRLAHRRRARGSLVRRHWQPRHVRLRGVARCAPRCPGRAAHPRYAPAPGYAPRSRCSSCLRRPRSVTPSGAELLLEFTALASEGLLLARYPPPARRSVALAREARGRARTGAPATPRARPGRSPATVTDAKQHHDDGTDKTAEHDPGQPAAIASTTATATQRQARGGRSRRRLARPRRRRCSARHPARRGPARGCWPVPRRAQAWPGASRSEQLAPQLVLLLDQSAARRRRS